jgi:hypothetical protein
VLRAATRRTRSLQDEQTLLLVRYIDVASGVNENILGLNDVTGGDGPVPGRRIGRDEVADLPWQPRVGYVVDTQTRVEVGQVCERVRVPPRLPQKVDSGKRP